MIFQGFFTAIRGAPRLVTGLSRLGITVPSLVIPSPRLVVGAPWFVVGTARLVASTSMWSPTWGRLSEVRPGLSPDVPQPPGFVAGDPQCM
jgi:hypothetical protein